VRYSAIALERVRDREVQLGRLRGTRQQLPIDLDRMLLLTETDERHRLEHAVTALGRILGEQPIGLFLRLPVQVAVDQKLRIIEARRPIVGSKLEDGLEQQLRIIERLARDCDAREQAHRLDIMTMLEQERADDPLGGRQIAV